MMVQKLQVNGQPLVEIQQLDQDLGVDAGCAAEVTLAAIATCHGDETCDARNNIVATIAAPGTSLSLLAEHGVTDLDRYSVVPGTTDFIPDFFVD